MKKEKDSIDAKYLVVIPDTFRKVKKRFNLKSLIFIKEDGENLFYVNSKGDLIAVMKDKNEFDKKDIEKRVFKFMKDNFNIKKIIV